MKHIKNHPIERSVQMELKSTEAGYVNKKNQKNLGKTSKPGTDNNQWFYQMECLDCGHKYFANGSGLALFVGGVMTFVNQYIALLG